MSLTTNNNQILSLSVSGGRPDEAAAELVVGDADTGPDPPADAQPPPRRDDAAQRTKVRDFLLMKFYW